MQQETTFNQTHHYVQIQKSVDPSVPWISYSCSLRAEILQIHIARHYEIIMKRSISQGKS